MRSGWWRRSRTLQVVPIQLALVILALALWQYVPQVPGLQARSPVFDPFFVSSPQRITATLTDLFTGRHGTPLVWPFLFQTIEAALIGTFVGTALGALVGLAFSNSDLLSRVMTPFVIGFNAMPRIALIPIIVIIVGPTLQASILTAILVVFFVAFFNAYEGGRTVPVQVLQSARIFGATPFQVMSQVRFPYVMAWTLAALPNAVSFGLVSVVTAEILTGTQGLGRLILQSITTVESSLTFAVVVLLSVLGIVLVTGAEMFKRRYLHWWGSVDATS